LYAYRAAVKTAMKTGAKGNQEPTRRWAGTKSKKPPRDPFCSGYNSQGRKRKSLGRMSETGGGYNYGKGESEKRGTAVEKFEGRHLTKDKTSLTSKNEFSFENLSVPASIFSFFPLFPAFLSTRFLDDDLSLSLFDLGVLDLERLGVASADNLFDLLTGVSDGI